MRNRGTVFIGVDLGASTQRKSTSIAYLVENNGKPWIESAPLHIISDEMQIYSYIKQIAVNFSYCIIAIDAPLSRPKHGTMRVCEIRLRKHGIPCYPSGAQWVSKWVDKGIELKKWAEAELDARVIEVYPYACRRILGIGKDVKKKTVKGRKVIQEGMMFIEGFDELAKNRLLSHDELDGVLSAYTAYCHGRNNSVKLDGVDGAIYLPLKMKDHRIIEY